MGGRRAYKGRIHFLNILHVQSSRFDRAGSISLVPATNGQISFMETSRRVVCLSLSADGNGTLTTIISKRTLNLLAKGFEKQLPIHNVFIGQRNRMRE